MASVYIVYAGLKLFDCASVLIGNKNRKAGSALVLESMEVFRLCFLILVQSANSK